MSQLGEAREAKIRQQYSGDPKSVERFLTQISDYTVFVQVQSFLKDQCSVIARPKLVLLYLLQWIIDNFYPPLYLCSLCFLSFPSI